MKDEFQLLLKEPEGVDTASPSSLKLLENCRRAWGFRYIDKIKSTSPAQKLGLSVHDQIENYLRFGRQPDYGISIELPKGKRYPGRIAAAGLHLLPKPRTAEVEKEFWIAYDDLMFHGLIDCWLKERVIDHKTCTSFQYQLTPQQLLDDVQGVIYSVVPHLAGEPQVPTLAWHYYKTSGKPEVRVTEAQIDVGEQFRKIRDIFVPLAREIQEIRASGCSSMDLAPNPGHCSAYGGCEHKEKCFSDRERFLIAMGFDFDVTDFAEKQQEKQNQALPSPPPEPPEAPEPDPPSAPGPQGGEEPPPPPPEMDLLDMSTWTRDQLKTKAMALGLVESKCRFGAERLLALLEKALKEDPPAEEPPPPPAEEYPPAEEPPPPPPPEEEPPPPPELPPASDEPPAPSGLPFPEDSLLNPRQIASERKEDEAPQVPVDPEDFATSLLLRQTAALERIATNQEATVRVLGEINNTLKYNGGRG